MTKQKDLHRLIDSLGLLIECAEELKTQWQWKKDELGQYADDYIQLEDDINTATVLFEELVLEQELEK
jgi:hypothetical protein